MSDRHELDLAFETAQNPLHALFAKGRHLSLDVVLVTHRPQTIPIPAPTPWFAYRAPEEIDPGWCGNE